jgi:hypothetical protein
MNVLTRQRCQHHAEREAVARCPKCAGFFCRECVTEHDDRVLCADCIAKLAVPKDAARPRREWPGLLGKSLLGLLAAWLFFYSIGRVLITLPENFHNGTLWKSDDAEEAK